MAVLVDQAISGSGTASFGFAGVASAVVHVTGIPYVANVIDPTTNKRLSRIGWYALGLTATVGSIASAIYYGNPHWIDFEWDFWTPYDATQSIADHVRWQLLDGATGWLVVQS